MPFNKCNLLLYYWFFLLLLITNSIITTGSNQNKYFPPPIKAYIDKYKKPFYLCVDTGSSFSWIISTNVRLNSHELDDQKWRLKMSKPLSVLSKNGVGNVTYHRFHKLKAKNILNHTKLNKRYGDGTLIKGFYTKRKLKLKYEKRQINDGIMKTEDDSMTKKKKKYYLIKQDFIFGLVNEINEFWAPPFESLNCDGYLGLAPFSTMKHKDRIVVNDYILKDIGVIIFNIGRNGFNILFNHDVNAAINTDEDEETILSTSSWLSIIDDKDNKHWKIHVKYISLDVNDRNQNDKTLPSITMETGTNMLNLNDNVDLSSHNNNGIIITNAIVHLDSGAGGIFIPYSMLKHNSQSNINSTWNISFSILTLVVDDDQKTDRNDIIMKQFSLDNLIIGHNLSFWNGGRNKTEIILGTPFFQKYNVSFYVNTIKKMYKVKIL